MNQRIVFGMFVGLFFFFQMAIAKVYDYGVHGALFNVGERSLLEVIQERLRRAQAGGFVNKWQQTLEKTARARVEEPQAVLFLPRAQRARRFPYDPSIVIDREIRDLEGRVITARGMRLNPLSLVSWGKPLVFLDGMDSAQVKWAATHAQKTKWVLLRGKPLVLGNIYRRPVYFDQGGRLAKRFKIQHLPARVSQENLLLVVEEKFKNKLLTILKGYLIYVCVMGLGILFLLFYFMTQFFESSREFDKDFQASKEHFDRNFERISRKLADRRQDFLNQHSEKMEKFDREFQEKSEDFDKRFNEGLKRSEELSRQFDASAEKRLSESRREGKRFGEIFKNI